MGARRCKVEYLHAEGERTVRIGDLSRRTGASVTTIKYYLREGLLPAGRLTSPNQASYDETHVQRLRFIHVLLDIGGLSVASVRAVVDAVDDPDRPVRKVLGTAAAQMVPQYQADPRNGIRAAHSTVVDLITRRGWQADEDAPAAVALAAALAALKSTGASPSTRALDVYADAAERVARADFGYVSRHVAREELVERVVVGTVLGDVVFAALRRLAYADISAYARGVRTEPATRR
ncbi:MerR family transcriptional regulator [Streptomyces sp. NPDC047981]|uniref:MerR family transcriptional regulator n=1 Tax=Streptomyces sp. NPDC047981 TaxID=3154610 RepID=UPI00341E851D